MIKPKKDKVLIILGENIRRLRLKKGLTQDALAEAVGVERQSINRAETGKAQVRTKVLEKIANTLEVEKILLYQISVQENQNSNRPYEAISAQEKLSHLALELSDVNASHLLDIAQRLFVKQDQVPSHTQDTIPKSKKHG